MKYYVVSDIHGFYTPMIQALTEAGFFEDKEPHKLIVCGDMFDRGTEAFKVQEFMLDLLHRYESDWRTADENAWKRARWYNGMELAHRFKVTEQGKTIVCGHWHTSFGHSKYEGKGSEFDKDSDFTPFCEKGILAIDACTAYSHKVNCIVIED